MQQYIRNVGALVGQSAFQRVLGMLTTIVVARTLGAGSLGVYSAVSATSSTVYGFVRMGVDGAIHVQAAQVEATAAGVDAKERLLGAGLLLLAAAGIVGGIAAWILSDWFAGSVYGQPHMARWLQFAVALVVLQCLFQFCSVTLAGLHRFGALTRVMAFSAVLTLVLVSAGSLLEGLSGAVVGLVLASLVTVMLLARAVREALRDDRLTLRFEQVWTQAKRLLSLGFPFYAAGLVAIPINYYMQGMLARHAGVDALGQLRVIASLTALVSFVPTSAAAAMVSEMSRAHSIDRAEFGRHTMLNLKAMWLFGTCASGLIASLAPLLLRVLFGSDYVAASAAAQIATAGAMHVCVFGVVANACLGAKRTDVFFGLAVVQAMIFCGVGLWLVPRAGVQGLAAAELISYYVLALAGSYGISARVSGRAESWLVQVVVASGLMWLGIAGLTQVDYGTLRVIMLLAMPAGFAVWAYRYALTDSERVHTRAVLERWAGRAA